MKDDVFDEDDLEELDDDDLDDLEEDDGDDDDFDDYDEDDFDDLEELDEEGAKGANKTGEALSPTDLEEGDEESLLASEFEAEDDDDDESFFNEDVDDGDDLYLDETTTVKVADEAAPVVPEKKTSGPAEPVVHTTEPEAKAFSPMLLLLPILGVLLGAGYFFLGGEKKSGPEFIHLLKEETQAPLSGKDPFIIKKPEIDDTIPDSYIKLGEIELQEQARISALVNRGLLKKKPDDEHKTIDSLTLKLFKTEQRYVVSQTYKYSDGTKWTVETHFSDPGSDQNEVLKAFNSVYSG